MRTEEQISLDSVKFEYCPGIPILWDITLSIQRGEFIGILGPNGSGKSTLGRLLNARLRPTAGILLVEGLLSTVPHNIRRIKTLVTLIESDPGMQFVTSTVFDEIAFALQTLKLTREEIIERVEAALTLFSLHSYRNSHPFHLSSGEQFRLLLAVALARRPHYLLLDEVTSMMDSVTRYDILQILSEQCAAGIAVILISHRIEDLLHADRILVLVGGKKEVEGPANTVLTQALVTPSWKIAVPITHQISSLLLPHHRDLFPELFQK
ncbi:MAG: ATP-binding cassette domain-containing protein [Ardenticatenales bacterium]|nr:ATP-binding cassette domain-containing protein [Ardenticatenales bacterium]